MQKTLIHIGYHKTGSTWLQQVFFPQCQDFERPVSGYTTFKRIVETNALDFCAEETRRFFAKKIEPITRAGRIPVISSERLCGSPFSGGRDSKEIADRLIQIFPEARVLIVIREQTGAITSTYKQYVLGGGSGSPRQFLSPPESACYSWFDAGHFRYEPLIRYYMSLWGAENVKVMFYERFKEGNIQFCRELAEFAGFAWKSDLHNDTVRLRVSPTDLSIAMLSFLNRFTHSHMYPWPLFVIPGLKRISDAALTRFDPLLRDKLAPGWIRNKVRQACSGMFSESNRKLDALLGVDLRSLGYE